jgi:hypothetical protein
MERFVRAPISLMVADFQSCTFHWVPLSHALACKDPIATEHSIVDTSLRFRRSGFVPDWLIVDHDPAWL